MAEHKPLPAAAYNAHPPRSAHPNFLVASDDSDFRHAERMARIGWNSDIPRRELSDVLRAIYAAKDKR